MCFSDEYEVTVDRSGGLRCADGIRNVNLYI